MDFKRIYGSSQTYIILLVVGFVLLLFTTGMAYRQIILMQKSADMVVHTLQVYNTLGDLTSHYTKAESEEFRKDLLENKVSKEAFESYKAEGRAIIDSLRTLTQDNDLQILRIRPLAGLLDTLHEQLVGLDNMDYKGEETSQILEWQKGKIANTLSDIRSIKNRMLRDEERYMLNRKAKYTLHKSLTPTMLLGTAFIALVVFIISFFRVYFGKLKIKKSADFLNSVLANTNNIVNYYEPVFDKGKITDFTIVFANDCNRDYLDLDPEELVGKSVLRVYPLHGSREELMELIQSYEEQRKVVFDRQIVLNDRKMWFHSIVAPLNEGILVTSRNSTLEEESKLVESEFKKRLEDQNSELLDSRAFLTNIFKSILHIVIHFKSIRDAEDNIVDFEILFINDRARAFDINIPGDPKNKRITEIYPDIFNSEIFKQLVHAVEYDEPGTYEMSYYKNNVEVWYQYTAIKLGDGVTVTIRDITQEKEITDEITKLNEELVIQNSILVDAERIAKSGSFSWHMGEDKIAISDNFYHMLGYEVNGFEPSFEKFREFIHPDDLEGFDRNGAKTMKRFQVSESTFRIITKQGVVKYFKANGQFISKNNNKVMIGVVQDVTQVIEAEEKLLKSNLELKNSNSELESFSRAASHDLQEPLRKIQLFTLRIEELDGDSLSDKSKDYFNKVTTAVKRMQALIENLLAYSQIDNSKKDFEPVDLNEILSKIKEDLAPRIVDSQAEVNSVKLPQIKGVAFQMEQLFTNLISNALKYRKDNESPIIQIDYKKVKAKDIAKDFATTARSYHKISFSDNGIGFDSQYAEKIFEVFQRLHQKTEYSGTGIGLAICKKIIENHNGFIYAKSEIGVGSEFGFYLPV